MVSAASTSRSTSPAPTEGRLVHVAETSVYTQATLHPWVTGAILGAAGIAVAAILSRRGPDA